MRFQSLLFNSFSAASASSISQFTFARLSMARRFLSSTNCAKSASIAEEEEYPPVRCEVANGVGILTLDRPKILNSVSLESIEIVHDKLLEWQSPHSPVQAVIIEGAGSKAFCAGGDVVSVVKDHKLSSQIKFFHTEYIVDHMVSTCSLPYISLWDGIVMGGGLGLSVHGAIRVATERAMIAMPETAIGLIPDVGGAFFLPRLQLKGLGMYMALSGHRLKGADCWFAGAATHLCPSIRIQQLKEDIVDAISPPSLPNSGSLKLERQAVLNVLGPILRRYSHDFAKPDMIGLTPYVQQMIGHCFGHQRQSVEEVLATLKESPGTWCDQQLSTMLRMSPSALKLTHKHIILGMKDKSVADTLKRDYRVVVRTLMHRPTDDGLPTKGADFYQGVNAVLVAKMKERPPWCPSTVEDVDDAWIDSFFHPFDASDVDENGKQITELQLPA